MVIAIRPDDTYEWVHKDDAAQSADKRTVFILRYLTAAESARLQDSLSKETVKGEERTLTGTFALLACRVGIVGVRNFCDHTGAEVPLTTLKTGVLGRTREVPTDEFLGAIPPGVRADIALAVLDQKVTEAEAKN